MTLSNETPFTDYLRDIHAIDYTGLDDDMPDHFDNWVTDMDIATIEDHGNKFGQLLMNKIR